MNSILRKSFGLVLVLFLMVFGLSSVVKVRATEYTSTVIFDGSALTSTATTEETSKTYSNFTYTISAGAKKQSSTGDNKFTENACLIGKSGAYIYNTTPFEDGIVSFEIYANKGASSKVSVGVYFSRTAIQAYNGSSDYTWTATLSTLDNVYDCSAKIPTGAKYFWYQVTNANNSQIEFRIKYNDRGDNDHCFVLFDANGGEGSMAGQKVEKSTETSLTNCTFTPPTDKQFAGWATSADGDVVYNNGANITINETTILYAKWEDAAGPTLLESVAITNGDINLKAGQTEQINLTFTPSNASNKNVTYQITEGSTYASVDENGLVTALAAGVATLRVTPEDTNADPVERTITVTSYPTPAITVGNYYYLTANGNAQLSGYDTSGSTHYATTTSYSVYPNDVHALLVEEGLYVNTVALKDGDDYICYSGTGNSLDTKDTIDESSSWIVTVSDGLYTVTNVAAQTRVLQFNNRFACYTTNQTKVVFIEKNDDPVVSISTTDSKVYLGGTLTFEEAVVHIEEPYDVNWSSTDETVATIDSNGVLHPVSIGVTTIKATIGVTESNGVNIVVLPNPSNPITVEQALAIAEATGESYTTDSFTTSGTLTYVNTSTITITDNTGTISVYKYNHGYTNENDGIKVQVEGKIINYNGTTKQFGSAVTISRLYTVTFNPDNGEMITTVEVVSGETVNCSTPNPTKDGYEFVCWKDGGNEWNFSTPITSDKELTAYWNELLAYAHLDFQAMTTVASLKVDYNTVSGAQILTDSFVGTKSSSKVLPENWSGSVGGTYGTNFWQSFRDVNQYIQSPEFGEAQSGVIVTFNYFLNNYGSSGNKSTKLQFIALDSLDNPILTVLSSELNVNETGIANAKTLIISLSATGIKKIKIVMIKDGGGNIAFSTVTVNSATYELQKNQSDKNLVSIRYAGLISSSLRDRLLAEGSVVTFGMIYGAASSFDSHSADEICGLLNAGSLDSSDLTTMGIRMRGIELVGVNSTGTQEVPNNPEYYQFGISINNFSDANLATLYQGAAYVCIDGVYYAMSDRTFSIYTLAKAYAEAGDTSSYAEHLGILNTLAALAN